MIVIFKTGVKIEILSAGYNIIWALGAD